MCLFILQVNIVCDFSFIQLTEDNQDIQRCHRDSLRHMQDDHEVGFYIEWKAENQNSSIWTQHFGHKGCLQQLNYRLTAQFYSWQRPLVNSKVQIKLICSLLVVFKLVLNRSPCTLWAFRENLFTRIHDFFAFLEASSKGNYYFWLCAIHECALTLILFMDLQKEKDICILQIRTSIVPSENWQCRINFSSLCIQCLLIGFASEICHSQYKQLHVYMSQGCI